MNEPQSAVSTIITHHHVVQGRSREDGSRFAGVKQKLHDTVRRSVTRKDESFVAVCCAWLVEHQIGVAVNLLVLLALAHTLFPEARRYCRKFLELSYYNPASGEYTIGADDACLVLFWVVVFTGLRAGIMEYLLIPFARHAGIRKKKDLARFGEQAWLLVYYMAFWPLGMYIMYHSDYWLKPKNFWTNWPNREIDGLLKWYILAQSAFWLQQIIVINIEKRRKDHWQMFTHHIITCSLLFASYAYHQTKSANAILCLMDVVDLFFPTAKCLKYLGYTKACDIMFGVFMVVWVVARHVSHIAVCFSVWRDIPIETVYGCYKGKKGALIGPFPPEDRFMHLVEPFLDPQGTVCFNHNIKWGFLTVLLLLQVLMIIWFGMICKVAAMVLRGGQADDTRSDDEDNEELEDPMPLEFERLEPVEVLPLEEEVGVEAINLKGHDGSSRRSKKSASTSSGVTLPGYSDRKELLRRIGCDKGV